MDYPFFPIIDRFNKKSVVVSDLENVRPLFPSEIKIDTVENEAVKEVVTLFSSSNNSGIMGPNLNLSPDPQQNPFIKMLGQKGKTLAATSILNNGGELMLISDSKFLADDAGMSVDENMIFLMNVVDYLAGDQDLISLRSREVTSRPLIFFNWILKMNSDFLLMRRNVWWIGKRKDGNLQIWCYLQLS